MTTEKQKTYLHQHDDGRLRWSRDADLGAGWTCMAEHEPMPDRGPRWSRLTWLADGRTVEAQTWTPTVH